MNTETKQEIIAIKKNGGNIMTLKEMIFKGLCDGTV